VEEWVPPGGNAVRIDLEERLPVWVGDRLLEAEQADAILAAERRRRSEAGRGEGRISLLAEALGYVGATLAIVAIGLIVSEFWDQLEPWARIGLSGLVTAATGIGGWVLRGSEEPAVRRLVSLLWAAMVAGVAFTVGLTVEEATELREENAVLVTASATAVAALIVYVARRTALQQLALLGSALVVLSSGVASLDTELSSAFWGLLFVGAGLAWAALAWGDLLPPRTLGLVTGLLVAGAGAQTMSFDTDPTLGILIGIGVAGLLVALSVIDRRTLFLGFGAFGLFVFVPQLVFEWFGDSLGAPFALLVTGLLLIVGAVGAARLKTEVIDEDQTPIHVPDDETVDRRTEVRS
jgi:hypothetical protein